MPDEDTLDDYVVASDDALDPFAMEGEPQPKTKEQLAEERREAAFDAIYSWKGRAFDGFSSSRKDLWRSVCHAAGYAPLTACFNELSLFHGHAKAAIYICLQDKKRLRELKARGLAAIVSDMEEWVDKNIKPHEETEAFDIGLKVFNDSCENAASAVPQTISPGK